ncbi:MAG: tetraacyldisaccharide 4'-kinase [Elusimicrobia bacterium]|nr:tetraacyldisaccharide 4'-kinase [Elusimicrobiota bacterium]
MSLEKLRNELKECKYGRLLLQFLSFLYLLALKCRYFLYDNEFLKPASSGVPVICFGNISTGGTGKTSMAILTAIELKKSGHNPAVLIRGYKRTRSSASPVALCGPGPFSIRDTGDEAMMLYNLLNPHSIPVIVGPDRIKTGKLALNLFKSDVLLLDDGFQNFSIKKDLKIILINAGMPFENEKLLPMGNLREPKYRLKTADIIILTHVERTSQKNLDTLKQEIVKFNRNSRTAAEQRASGGTAALRPQVSEAMPTTSSSVGRYATRPTGVGGYADDQNAPILETVYSPECFIDAFTMKGMHPAEFKKEAAVISGIGDPGSFEENLKSLKISLRQAWRYPDHHFFTVEEMTAIETARHYLPLITTHKDFVRFPENWREIFKTEVYIFSAKIQFLLDGYRILMNAITEQIANNKK